MSREGENIMKWFIGSDVHGSSFYTNKMIEAYEREKADKMLLLGDLLYHGPRNPLPKDYAPQEVLKTLNKYKESIIAVRGNCDSEVDQMVLEFPIMADYAVISICVNGKENRTMYATHGHCYNPEKLPPLQKGDILLNGHTHVPACEEKDHYVYMNPGSVSIPKECSEHSYLIIEDGVCYWKNMDGNTYLEYPL